MIIIKLFIDNKADLNMQNDYGNTALMMLCTHDDNEHLKLAIKLFIDNGVILELINNENKNFLDFITNPNLKKEILEYIDTYTYVYK